MLEEEMNLCNSSSATTTTTNVPKSKPNAASCDEIDEDDVIISILFDCFAFKTFSCSQLARRLERLRSPSSSSVKTRRFDFVLCLFCSQPFFIFVSLVDKSSNKQSSAPSMLSSLFSSFGLGSSSAGKTNVFTFF